MQANTEYDFGIINWWWGDDHGAILTAYALQQFVKQCGYSSQLMKCWRHYSEEQRRNGISDKFSNRHLSVTDEVYNTYEDIYSEENNRKLNAKFKGFITGSDQVFRAEWTPDSWFLTFVHGRGKIAAAASFGNDTFYCPDASRRERLRESVQTFDFISIREDDGVRLCREVFDSDAVHLLDPVFLVDRAKYDELSDMAAKKEKKQAYIFCYIRDRTEENTCMIDRMAEKYNLETIFCTPDMEVEEFLYYMKNSSFVITDSYHGLCFAAIYEKNYLCILNTLRGKSRFESLQRQIGLPQDSFVEEGRADQVSEIPVNDYKAVRAKMDAEKKYGREWLRNALDTVYNRYK